MRELPCDNCQRITLFELPPCVDGHGPDCPELACTECGAALLVATAAGTLTGPLHRHTNPGVLRTRTPALAR